MPGSEAGSRSMSSRSADGDGQAHRRLDLSPGALRCVAVLSGIGLLLALLSGIALPHVASGSPVHQAMAGLGTVLVLVPVAFSLVKRSGHARGTPAWFSAHVLASAAGAILVSAHASAGDLISPPGLVWIVLMALLVQGLAARSLLPHRTSAVFASRVDSFNEPDPDLRERLRTVINAKRELLAVLDPAADEALFSPDLRHALRHPWMTLRYARLAAREARLVGRQRAGLVLAFWRRTHIALAVLFVLGVCIHVVLVLFFAGYVARGGPVDWWHITAWGG